MQIKEGYLLREIDGEYVIVPTGQNVMNFNAFMKVNKTGQFIIDLLQHRNMTHNEILAEMMCRFEAAEEERQQLSEDLYDFLQEVDRAGLLEA